MPQHPREQVVRKQADVVGEHAEDEPVDEVHDRRQFLAALAQRLGHRRERDRRALGERLPGAPPATADRDPRTPTSAGPASTRRPGRRVRTRASGGRCSSSWCGSGTAPCRRRSTAARSPAPASTAGAGRMPRLPGEVVALPDVGPAVAAGVLVRAPSKQYVSPDGAASAGVGSPSTRHRSMKCSCDGERSFSAEARHFVMKAWSVTAATLRPRP